MIDNFEKFLEEFEIKLDSDLATRLDNAYYNNAIIYRLIEYYFEQGFYDIKNDIFNENITLKQKLIMVICDLYEKLEYHLNQKINERIANYKVKDMFKIESI